MIKTASKIQKINLLYVQVADKSSIKSTSYQIQPKSNHLLTQGLVDNLFFEGNILLNTRLLPFMMEFGYSLSNAFEYCFVWLRPDDTFLKHCVFVDAHNRIKTLFICGKTLSIFKLTSLIRKECSDSEMDIILFFSFTNIYTFTKIYYCFDCSYRATL